MSVCGWSHSIDPTFELKFDKEFSAHNRVIGNSPLRFQLQVAGE
jgi:hypothetical protein